MSRGSGNLRCRLGWESERRGGEKRIVDRRQIRAFTFIFKEGA